MGAEGKRRKGGGSCEQLWPSARLSSAMGMNASLKQGKKAIFFFFFLSNFLTDLESCYRGQGHGIGRGWGTIGARRSR